jgi:hypothetical protein
MRWVGHVACTGKEKYIYGLSGEICSTETAWRLKSTKWVVAIRLDFEETGWKVVDESG